MHELQWIRSGLADRRLGVVADKTGLSVPTLRAVRDGTGNPTIGTLDTIANYLRGVEV